MRESRRPEYATIGDLRGTLDKYDMTAGDCAHIISTLFEPVSGRKLRGILAKEAPDAMTFIHRSELDAVSQRLEYEIGLTGRKPPS